MNPGIFGAVGSVVNRKKDTLLYKREYTKCYGKVDAKVIWKTHINDLIKRASEFKSDYFLIKNCIYMNDADFAIALFKIIQKYNNGNCNIENIVCYDDEHFDAYEKLLYEKLKKKYGD